MPNDDELLKLYTDQINKWEAQLRLGTYAYGERNKIEAYIKANFVKIDALLDKKSLVHP